MNDQNHYMPRLSLGPNTNIIIRTLKFLIGIAPSDYITFLSDCYGGRASDKYIVLDSGFLDLIERDDYVMAGRGFQIKEDLLMKFCSILIPPGARAKSQFTEKEVRKTKEVANSEFTSRAQLIG